MPNAVEQVTPERDVTPQWRSTGGKLMLMKCEECDKPFYYPRAVCPFCLGQKLSWIECSGKGRIYSYSVTHRGEPFAIAIVTLEEGPRMTTNIVDWPLDKIVIDQSVSVVFKDLDGVQTPMFRPDAE